LFVARRPLVYWSLVGLLAAVTAGVVVDRSAAADAARRRWGEARSVLVATHDLSPGSELGPDDARVERWPVALVPRDALSAVGTGAIVAAPMAAGEPLVRRRLGRVGTGPVAGLLPEGTRGVSVPAEAPPPVRPGDRVDVVGVDPAGGGVVIATSALVVRVDERSVVIAVGLDDVGRVAGAASRGDAVLVVDGDPPAG
jgi:Flp pilus assembly protein CpaB